MNFNKLQLIISFPDEIAKNIQLTEKNQEMKIKVV